MSHLFRLDPSSGVPFYRQVIDQVLLAIADGRLKPGTQLPTVRQLAVDLSVNLNTVAKAYREMEIRGLVETQQGTGTFIAARASDAKSKKKKKRWRRWWTGSWQTVRRWVCRWRISSRR